MDLQQFHDIVRQPLEGLDPFGLLCQVQSEPGLFRWCLHRDVRTKLADQCRSSGPEHDEPFWRHNPILPTTRGDCWVVFTNHKKSPLLADAFLLPFRWQPEPHSERLPAVLRDLAVQIRNKLADELDEVREQCWGLHMAPVDGLDGLDVSWLTDMKVGSGWAALAAGLVVAARGGQPDNGIWATGAWDQARGHWHVELASLAAKLQLAATHDVSVFFVPTSAKDNALAEIAIARERDDSPALRDLRIAELRDVPGEREARENLLSVAVRPYWTAWRGKPAATDPFQTRANYFLDALGESSNSGGGEPQNQARRNSVAEFYCDCLAEEIATKNRQLLDSCDALRNWRPSHFITVVSQSWELVELGVRLFRPENCLLIHTGAEDGMEDGMEGPVKAAVGRLREIGRQQESDIAPELGPVDDTPQLFEQILKHVEEFCADATPGGVAIDLTPGKRLMALALLNAAPIGSRVLCWWHDSDSLSRRVIPGTERAQVFQVAEGQRLHPLWLG